MAASDIFEPYGRLVSMRILGREAKVPENNLLLRCYQYLAPQTVPYGDFCWNADCRNCAVTLLRSGRTEEVLSCQTLVQEGDEIVELGPEVEYVLLPWLQGWEGP